MNSTIYISKLERRLKRLIEQRDTLLKKHQGNELNYILGRL